MANSGLTKMAKRMIDRIEKAEGLKRESVQDHVGQIFVWKREAFKSAMLVHASEDTVVTLVLLWQKTLRAADTKMMKSKEKARLKAVKLKIKSLALEQYNPAQDELYAVFNYGTVERIKRTVGAKYKDLTNKDAGLVTGNIAKGTKAGGTPGAHIGHGEFGHAVSTTKALGAESVMKTKTMKSKHGNSASYKRLENTLNTYKEKMGIDLTIEHHQEVTARGKLSKKYTAILSSQGAGDNMAESLGERKALQELRDSLKEEYAFLLNTEGSDTLLEAIEAVTLSNLVKSKYVKMVKGVKPKTSSKSQAKKRKKDKVQATKSAKIISGAGAIRSKKRASKRSSRGDSGSGSPLRLIGLINEKLPDTVRKNMNAPALENRTGKFAASVRLTDVVQTPHGFPSFGYTYQKNPYQVFEDGGGTAPWANGDRDPRDLIDKSIREIAAQFAIGRFYTRRE